MDLKQRPKTIIKGNMCSKCKINGQSVERRMNHMPLE